MAKQQQPKTSPTTNETYIQANRTLWDAWTKLHLQPRVYGVEEFKAGRSKLTPIELDELGDVAGKSLLHLQCHFGLDTLSWARRGAIVTGVDLSPEAVASAQTLSRELDIPARFVCANVYDLTAVPELRDEHFDIVFTSYGVLSWLPDLWRWAQVIAHFLKPRGTFFLVEHHPLIRVIDPETHDSAGNPLDRRYFHRREPVRAEYAGTYAAPEAGVWTTGYFWDHPLSDVVTALCDAGLHLEFLHEHAKPAGATYHAGYPDDLPYVFSIRATAPPRTPARRNRAVGPSRSERSKTKYYWEEHEHGYQRAEREGLAGWNELHGGHGFENFSSRDFLEQALPLLDLPAAPGETDMLEYGCGTGPGACFLAARGFRVDAVDLSPTAIKLARRFAAERGLTVRFAVEDICAAADRPPEKRYDLIVDSYCLQSVVTDADRAKLFAFVRARLKPDGYYLVSTAMFDPDRSYADHERYEPESGIVYDRVRGDPERYDGAVQIDGTWCLPNRRHLTPAALRRELEAAGFRVLWQGGRLGGDVICVPRDGTGALRPSVSAPQPASVSPAPAPPSVPRSDTAQLDVTSVLDWINTEHGTAYVLGERYPVGTEGAWRVHGPAGLELVLKFEPGPQHLGPLPAALETLRRLGARGYPVPRYVTIGIHPRDPAGRYTLQEKLQGAVAPRIDDGLLSQILALSDLQAGIGLPELAPPSGWRNHLIDCLFEENVGGAAVKNAAFHSYSAETAALLDCLRDYVQAHATAPMDTCDVVHFDFNRGHVMAETVSDPRAHGGVRPGRITGVIDFEGPVTGDRVFDLVTMLFYDYGHPANSEGPTQRAWDRACALVGAQTTGIYMAHIIHRQVGACVRWPNLARWTDHFLRSSVLALAELEKRTSYPLVKWRR